MFIFCRYCCKSGIYPPLCPIDLCNFIVMHCFPCQQYCQSPTTPYITTGSLIKLRYTFAPCLGPCPFIKLVPLEAAVHRIQTRFINIHYVTEQQAAAFVVHGLKDYMGRAVHTDGTEGGTYSSYGTVAGMIHMLWEEELIPGEKEK